LLVNSLPLLLTIILSLAPFGTDEEALPYASSSQRNLPMTAVSLGSQFWLPMRMERSRAFLSNCGMLNNYVNAFTKRSRYPS
jgi:hypothetical protein